MKSLYDFEILVNEVFYKCWHILEYIEKHKEMSELDKEAIEATIMDALVTRNLIDPNTQSLDLKNLCIVNNLNYYKYEKYPNICGIPLWMKEEFRKKSLKITGGIPISMFLAKPPSKFVRYCVYDPNTAVSSIFKDAAFYNSKYISPTRNVIIEEQRPFVEVNIDGELYLVDTLTKRILKSSWFKKKYQFETISEQTISRMAKKRLSYYKDQIKEHNALKDFLYIALELIKYELPEQAEMKYEIEQSKKYFPEEWKKYKEIKEEFENHIIKGLYLKKNKDK